MRNVSHRLHACLYNVIMIVTVKCMRPCQSLNAAASIAANPNLMDGTGDRREGVDDARHAETVRYWES